MQPDPVRSSNVADLVARHPDHFESTGQRHRHVDSRPDQQLTQSLTIRCAHIDQIRRRLPDEIGDRHIRDQSTATDHQQVISCQRHLRHQMRRDQHRSTLARQIAQQMTDPQNAIRIQTIHRFVENQRRRITQQRRRDPEALPHPQGKPANPLRSDISQTNQPQQLVDSTRRDPTRRREHQQMIARRTTVLDSLGLEQRTHLVQRRLVIRLRPAVHTHRPARRRIEPDDHPHRRRFPSPIRAQEPGHDPRPHREREIIHSNLVAITLHQTNGFDHPAPRLQKPAT